MVSIEKSVVQNYLFLNSLFELSQSREKVRLFEQKYRKSFEDFETELSESYSRFNKLYICNSAGKKVALAT